MKNNLIQKWASKKYARNETWDQTDRFMFEFRESEYILNYYNTFIRVSNAEN